MPITLHYGGLGVLVLGENTTLTFSAEFLPSVSLLTKEIGVKYEEPHKQVLIKAGRPDRYFLEKGIVRAPIIEYIQTNSPHKDYGHSLHIWERND